MKRDAAACAGGHDVHRVDDRHGERIVCSCGDLDVPAPAGHVSLSTAYRTWAGPQGYLEGVARGEA